MKLSTGLTVSLAVLVTGLYTWGISTDPDGFGGLIRDRSQSIEGAVPLSAAGIVGDDAGDITSGDEEKPTWKAIGKSASQAVVFKLRPPEAASLDESFMMFLDGLNTAVRDRDIDGILAYSAEDIVVSYSRSETFASLEDLLSSSGGERIWDHLQSVLALPMAKSADGAYCAPWFSCLAMPEDAGLVEPFETVFVTGEDVPVYEAPSEQARQMMTLSYDAVRLAGSIDDANWLKVELPADRTGYIARDQVRMMFDTHVDFEQLDSGLWAMTSLVIGD